MHIPSERISVVVMLNHEADAAAAAEYIYKHLVDCREDESTSLSKPAKEWTGDFLDEGTQLRISIKASTDKPGQLKLRYTASEESLKLTSQFSAEAGNVKAKIEGDMLHLERLGENKLLQARRIAMPSNTCDVSSSDYVGAYRSEEVESSFHCSGGNGTLYGCFDGFLGKGPIWLMRYLGEDVWILGTPRGMDAGPPGDWTVVRTLNLTPMIVAILC